MFLGYNTNGFAHHRLEDAVDILAELGYKGLGLTADFHTVDPMARNWRDRAVRLRKHLREVRLRAVVETGARFVLDPKRKHQPTLLDPDRHKALERLHYLEACIELAVEIDESVVSFWSGAAPPDIQPKILMARLVESCQRLCHFAGDRRVRLAFEPEPGMFIDTMDKFAELHDKVNDPAFGLTLDVGHAHCLCELPISDHIRKWQDKLFNVHIEDMKRGVHEHLMFGEGEVDFADVFGALKDVGYSRGVYVELSRHSHDAVETAKKAMAFLSPFAKAKLDPFVGDKDKPRTPVSPEEEAAAGLLDGQEDSISSGTEVMRLSDKVRDESRSRETEEPR
jgi:L-ribulose-5-phosphate 3-epimerase